MDVTSEYSTIDSAILALGALFAGNYFGGEGAALAQDLLESVQWSDAIESADWPRIFSVVDKVTGDMAGYIAPYNEYYLVAYLANMTSPPGSKASQHFATFMVPVLRLVPMATQCRSPTRASTCSLTTTTTT